MVDFEELRRLFEAGNESALYQAANACRDPTASEVNVPSWVIEALVERQVEHMTRLARTGKGRRWFAQHRKDLVHLARHTEVVRQRKEGRRAPAVYEKVAADLVGTPWHDPAGWTAIRASYELVKRVRKEDPEEFRRRFWFGHPGAIIGKKQP